MKEWAILSNVVNCIQYDGHPKIFMIQKLKLQTIRVKRKGPVERKKGLC